MMKKVFRITFVLILSVLLSAYPASALSYLSEDFESAYPGDDPLGLDTLYGYFEWLNATPDSACDIISDNGRMVMRLSGYSDLRTIDYIPAEYALLIDIKIPKASDMINVFVRGEMPGAMQKKNPRNFDITQVFNYYEWDWYAENGGKGGSGVGGSGISMSFRDGKIAFCVKKYASDSLTVASDVYKVDYPEGVAVGDYENVRVTDDAKKICFYLNGTLTAYFELSEEKTSYPSDGTNVEYFKSVTVYGADGTELGRTEDTRLHYKGSQIAFATRSDTAYVDGLKIYYGDGAIRAAESGEIPVETKDAETEAGTVAPETTDADSSAPDTTGEEETTGAVKENGATSKKLKIVLIAAAADAVIIAAMAVLIPKKKK